MPTYNYTGAVAYDRLGSSWRTAAGLRSVSVTDPATGLVPANLRQGGVAVSWLTADANSRYSFSCDVSGVVVDFGSGAEALYANEIPGLAITSVAASEASAASAAASAALVGAPADSAIAAVMGAPASTTRGVTDTIFGRLPDPAERVLYASVRGSDANDGLTLKSAKATIAGALTTLAGQPGRIVLAAQDFPVTAPLLFSAGQSWEGFGGAQILTGQTKIVASGFTGSVVAPATPTTNTVNFSMTNIAIDAGITADVGLNLTRTSYSHFQGVFVTAAKAGAAGYLLDAGVTDQCYFNKFDLCKASAGSGTGMRFQNGANANQINGGKYGNAQTGVELLTISAWNVFTGVDFETNAVRHVYVDAPENVFLGCHMEGSPVGYTKTANSTGTVHLGTSYDSACVTRVVEAAGNRNQIVHEMAGAGSNQPRWGAGLWRMVGDWFSTGTEWQLDAKTFSGTGYSIFRFFFNTTTTGARQLIVHPGDGTSTVQFQIDAATGDIDTVGKLRFRLPTGGWRTLSWGTAAPTTGTWAWGSEVKNQTPAVGSPKAWVCTVAGTPGTWVSTGNL